MVVILIIVGVIAWWWYSQTHSYGDTEFVKQCIEEGRSESQIQSLRFFCNNPGCLNEVVSYGEYEEIVSSMAQSLDFKKMALEKIGIDEDELTEIDPVCLNGYVYDSDSYTKPKIKMNEEGTKTEILDRYSSKYQISWLFFSTSQMFVYQYTFNTDKDDTTEHTAEFFYKDITNFSTTDEIIDAKRLINGTTTLETEKINIRRFVITVPGDKFYCSMENSDNIEHALHGMKSLLRDMKNNG